MFRQDSEGSDEARPSRCRFPGKALQLQVVGHTLARAPSDAPCSSRNLIYTDLPSETSNTMPVSSQHSRTLSGFRSFCARLLTPTHGRFDPWPFDHHPLDASLASFISSQFQPHHYCLQAGFMPTCSLAAAWPALAHSLQLGRSEGLPSASTMPWGAIATSGSFVDALTDMKRVSTLC